MYVNEDKLLSNNQELIVKQKKNVFFKCCTNQIKLFVKCDNAYDFKTISFSCTKTISISGFYYKINKMCWGDAIQ